MSSRDGGSARAAGQPLRQGLPDLRLPLLVVVDARVVEAGVRVDGCLAGTNQADRDRPFGRANVNSSAVSFTSGGDGMGGGRAVFPPLWSAMTGERLYGEGFLRAGGPWCRTGKSDQTRKEGLACRSLGCLPRPRVAPLS